MNNLSGESTMESKNVLNALRLAKMYSLLEDYNHFKVGAVIYYKNKMLSYGFNTTKDNPTQHKYNRFRDFENIDCKSSSHAEMNAIRSFLRQYRGRNIDPSKLVVYVFRQHKDRTLVISKPCPACEVALRQLGVKEVYYTGNCSIVHESYK